MTMKMKRQEVRIESRDMWSNVRLGDTDFVESRGDKYFRFVRTKKGSVDSRNSGATRRGSFKGVRSASVE